MNNPVERLAAALSDHYAIEHELGAGGMATVYLAHDLKHDRNVAVKVLRPELAAVVGADRFLTEIKVTANLQHPHILPLFDSGEAQTFLYYVMPYVEGESLRDRLNREKLLPVEDAIAITKEIASALDYAHRHDVIHRDIKPENILLHDGQALVADFGIALAVSTAGGDRLTETGYSVGTPHYMSPEQAAADRELDARSDIYSLGCLTYEMLTGEAPFTGATVDAIIAKRLTETPRSIRTVRDTVPVALDHAVAKALARIPADRYKSAALFSDALTTSSGEALATARVATESPGLIALLGYKRRIANWQLLAAAVVFVVLAGLVLMDGRGDAPQSLVTRFDLILPSSEPLASASSWTMDISQDGSKLVYVGDGSRLYMRPMNQRTIVPLPGTEGAYNPFFSPDGEWVGFGAEGVLKKVALAGGPPVTLYETPGTIGGMSWGAGDEIIIDAPTGDGLLAIPSIGGPPRDVGVPDPDRVDEFFSAPHVLPGGKRALLSIVPGYPDSAIIGIISLETGKLDILPLIGFSPKYSHSGHIVYGRADGVLLAAPFDLDGGEVLGPPVPVLEDVRTKGIGVVEFALSSNGTLVYLPAAGARRRLVLVDRGGFLRPITPDTRPFYGPRFAPDGRQVAVTVYEEGARNVWLYDTERGTGSRRTFESDNLYPVWAPDGTRLAFSSSREGTLDLYIGAADESGVAEPILSKPYALMAGSWSPDSRLLFFTESHPGGGRDIWVMDVDGDRTARPLLTGPHEERSPMLSPNGRWLAYASNESGRFEVYVQAFPGPGGRWLVSTDGGAEPLWSRDGRELFYRSGNRIVVADVVADPVFAVQRRTVLFEGPYVPNAYHTNYDITADGQRFVMVESAESTSEVVMVLNWFEELQQTVPRR